MSGLSVGLDWLHHHVGGSGPNPLNFNLSGKGGAMDTHAQERLDRMGNTDAQQQALNDAAARAQKLAEDQWNLWLANYGPDSAMGKQLAGEADLKPENIEAARGQATADVERQYSQALRQKEENNRVMGINPSSGAAQALDTRAGVGKTAARVGAGENAALAERKYRTGLGMALTGQGSKLGDWSTGTGGQEIGALTSSAQTAAADEAARASLENALLANSAVSMQAFGIGGGSGGGFHFAEGGPVEEPPRFYDYPDLPTITHQSADGGMTEEDPLNPDAWGHLMGPGDETSDGIDAKLSKNEFVFPAFASIYYGTKKLNDMIEKARAVEVGKDPNAAPQRIAGQAPRGPGMLQPSAPPALPPSAPMQPGYARGGPVYATDGGFQAGGAEGGDPRMQQVYETWGIKPGDMGEQTAVSSYVPNFTPKTGQENSATPYGVNWRPKGFPKLEDLGINWRPDGWPKNPELPGGNDQFGMNWRPEGWPQIGQEVPANRARSPR